MRGPPGERFLRRPRTPSPGRRTGDQHGVGGFRRAAFGGGPVRITGSGGPPPRWSAGRVATGAGSAAAPPRRRAGRCGGPPPSWTTEEENRTLMRYTLQEAAPVAEPRGIAIAVETHGEYTATPERLDRHWGLIEGPALTIHLDTGNSYLSGNDPHAWLETIVGRATHPPTKDISHEEAARYRAKFRGTLGCACGEGVIAWERIVSTLATADHDVVHFVKCASLEAATKSYAYLSELIGAHAP
ncbi:sugar phosphate isomerase/epimerase [Streptomyces antimycoticus]|uniref:sugar phosphate isomerase/epimerase family protein n=1 Tax=Streptomyces antimycoticus TaxID=68175 RepID=UPI0034164BE7